MPFVIACLAIVKMDPGGVLLGLGVAMIATGLWYRTPFPAQPMKAIGAAWLSAALLAMALLAQSRLPVMLLLLAAGAVAALAREPALAYHASRRGWLRP